VNSRFQKNLCHPRKSPELWFSILKDFCERDITYPTDRVTALSATAQRLFQKPDRYIAGLPRDEVPSYLVVLGVN
jgi:hypothetical protein